MTHKHFHLSVGLLALTAALFYGVSYYNQTSARQGLSTDSSAFLSNVSMYSSNADQNFATVDDEIFLSFTLQNVSSVQGFTTHILGEQSKPQCLEKDQTDLLRQLEIYTAEEQVLLEKLSILQEELNKLQMPLTLIDLFATKAFAQDLDAQFVDPIAEKQRQIDILQLEINDLQRKIRWLRIDLEKKTYNCMSTVTVSKEVIESGNYTIVPFVIEVWATTLDNQKEVFQKDTTDDGSFVTLVAQESPVKINNINIFSNNATDTTFAYEGEKVTLKFDYLQNPLRGKVSVSMGENIVPIACTYPEVVAQAEQVADTAVKQSKVDTPQAAEFVAKSPPVTNSSFVSCTSEIIASSEDVDKYLDQIYPFAIFYGTTDHQESFSKTTDESFVVLRKEKKVQESATLSTTTGSTNGVVFYNNGALSQQTTPINTPKTTNPIVDKTCPYITGFYKLGDKKENIKNLRQGINKTMGTNLPINNVFDRELFDTVKAWQEKYRNLVLDPWEMKEPSGYFYKTSNWSMNHLMGCEMSEFILEKYQ